MYNKAMKRNRMKSYLVQLLATVTVGLKLNYCYCIQYFWRYLVAIQAECSANCKEQAVNYFRRETIYRNQSAPFIGAVLTQEELGCFGFFSFNTHLEPISMSVGLSTKSSDVNEMEEENLNPSRENKKNWKQRRNLRRLQNTVCSWALEDRRHRSCATKLFCFEQTSARKFACFLLCNS